jgi:hypothetical protein
MIESESLLRQQFCFFGTLFKNSVGSEKKIVASEKKLLTVETDLSMLSVWLQRRFYSAATLVFENRIAVV